MAPRHDSARHRMMGQGREAGPHQGHFGRNGSSVPQAIKAGTCRSVTRPETTSFAVKSAGLSKAPGLAARASS